MSGARRAYDLIRGYVNHGWDQLSHSEEDLADQELREAISNPVASESGKTSVAPEPEPQVTLDQARSLFGVAANATSKQIEEAFDSLKSATDITRFQEGSESWQRARLLRRRLEAARRILIDNLDPTVRRFERLEIE